MMNQETYVKVHELRKQGWTIGEIAAETGFHPETISIQLKSEEPPMRRRVPDTALVMNARWKQRIEGLIGTYPRLLGISVHNKLHAEGFEGGYSTVTRELRTIRGPRFRAADAASMPIHTDPGEEAQFDFCDLSDWARRWGWPTPLWCFGMILCWSEVADVVVHHLRGPPAHLRRHRPVLRHRRRDPCRRDSDRSVPRRPPSRPWPCRSSRR